VKKFDKKFRGGWWVKPQQQQSMHIQDAKELALRIPGMRK
jgi:hypothetical protein